MQINHFFFLKCYNTKELKRPDENIHKQPDIRTKCEIVSTYYQPRLWLIIDNRHLLIDRELS